MLQKLNYGAIVGLLIQTIAGIIMGVLVLMGRPVPDVAAWIFFAGTILTLVFTLFVKKKES